METDKYGNVKCAQCGAFYAPTFTACVKCCPHDNLRFIEEWSGGWVLSVECSRCGKNHDWPNSLVISNYTAVKKTC